MTKPRNRAERIAFFSEKNRRRALVTNPRERAHNRMMGRALATRTWNPKDATNE